MNNDNNNKANPDEGIGVETQESNIPEIKLSLNFDDQPSRSKNDRHLDALEFLIEQNRLDRSDSDFYQSMRTHLLDKGFLSQTQREYIVKGIGHLLGVKHFVPNKPSKGGA